MGMVLVRKALALYEADEAKKSSAADPDEPPLKKRRGRPAKAEKAKAADSRDLRNADSYERLKKEDGGIE